ncbi:MAG: peptidoglycan-binding domain-containing protein [Candidatus Paceibacterota bacterium]
MKKYTLFGFVLFVTLFSFNVNSLSAASIGGATTSGCLAGDMFSRTTGQACGTVSTSVTCPSGDVFSSVTGQRCNEWYDNSNSSGLTQFRNLFQSWFKVGASSTSIKPLQQFLKDQGYYFGKIDGKYGRITDRAVRDFQGDNNLASGSTSISTTTSTPVSTSTCSSYTFDSTTGDPLPCGCKSTSGFSWIDGTSCAAAKITHLNPALAATGSMVEVYGSNFNNTSWVSIGGAPMAVGTKRVIPSSYTNTSLSFVIPADMAPGTYKLFVANRLSSGDFPSNSVLLTVITKTSTCSSGGFDSATGFRCGCTSITGFSSVDGTFCGTSIFISTPSLLPNAKAGSTYLTTLDVSSEVSTNNLYWSVISGSLPTGLIISASDLGAIITGTPSVAGTYTFTLQASDSALAASSGDKSVSKQFTLTVDSATTTHIMPILSPSGGEQWDIGSTHTIQWQSSSAPSDAHVYLEALLPSGQWVVINGAGNLLPATGSYAWTIPSTIYSAGEGTFYFYQGTNYKIRAVLVTPSDPSQYISTVSNSFTIISEKTLCSTSSDCLSGQICGSSGMCVANTATVVNGVCGSATASQLSAPTIAVTSLCSTGTLGALVGASTSLNTWTWNCLGLNGGTTASCSVPKVGASTSIMPITNTSLTKGTVGISYTEYLQTGAAGLYTWSATGLPTGLSLTGNTISGTPTVAGTYTVNVTLTSTSSSSVTPGSKQLTLTIDPATTITAGVCGSLNGTSIAAIPPTLGATSQCSAGTASVFSGSGPWTWTCAGSNGGTTASCSVSKTGTTTATIGQCGSSSGKNFTSVPTSNLCSAGTASSVTGSGASSSPWLWTCTGTLGYSGCSALKTNTTTTTSGGTTTTGGCGSALGGTFSSAPTSGLCIQGFTPDTVYRFSDSKWTWNCNSNSGGMDWGCGATATGVLGAESFHFTQFLEQGSTGNEVMELQKFLKKAGYDVGNIDGIFGPKVKLALITFQIVNHLKGDGIVGSEVRAFLNKEKITLIFS